MAVHFQKVDKISPPVCGSCYDYLFDYFDLFYGYFDLCFDYVGLCLSTFIIYLTFFDIVPYFVLGYLQHNQIHMDWLHLAFQIHIHVCWT